MATAQTSVETIVHKTQDHTLRIEAKQAPAPSAQQYLVRVHAVGITKGELFWPEPNSLPEPIPGFDVAGTVVQSPSSQSRFQPGDKVYALTAFGRPANARELTVVDEAEIARMPEDTDFDEAAAVPMSALTAKEALFDKFGLAFQAGSPQNAEKSLLIVGTSGAVGIWAAQLARWAGVRQIVGMCGPDNVDFVRSLGADLVIDRRQHSLRDWVSSRGSEGKFDLVLDTVGGEILGEAWTAVKPNGQLLCVAQPIGSSRPADGVSDGVAASFFIVRPDGHQLAELTTLIEQKVVKPFIDHTYAFEDFQQAFGRVESGHSKGKVIIKVM